MKMNHFYVFYQKLSVEIKGIACSQGGMTFFLYYNSTLSADPYAVIVFEHHILLFVFHELKL